MINLFFEDVQIPNLDSEFFINWLSSTCVEEGKVLEEVNLIFCSDEYLLKMNIEYLQHDYYTDIISFDYSIKDRLSGDIFISIDTVHDNAKKFKVSVVTELRRVIIHGLLHFIGLKDKTKQDAILMRKAENLALEKYCLLFHVEQN